MLRVGPAAFGPDEERRACGAGSAANVAGRDDALQAGSANISSRSATGCPMNSEKVIGSPIGRNDGAPALLRRAHRNAAPSIHSRRPSAGHFGPRRCDRLDPLTPSIVASRTTSSNLSAFSSAIASVMVDGRFRRRGVAASPSRTMASDFVSASTVARCSRPRPSNTRTVSPIDRRSTRIRCCASSGGSGAALPAGPISGA